MLIPREREREERNSEIYLYTYECFCFFLKNRLFGFFLKIVFLCMLVFDPCCLVQSVAFSERSGTPVGRGCGHCVWREKLTVLGPDLP